MKHNKLLIIGACMSLLLVLMVGYAVFQTNLIVNGTSNISSNWQVEITDITTKTITGDASNESAPVASGTAATFKTNLQSPGDAIEYEVTITNSGTLDASLDEIQKTNSSNPAIVYTVSGINKDDIIVSGESLKFIVKVEYSDSVVSQPSTLLSSLTVDLNFVQA